MNPTDEQLQALELFRTGDSLAIEAGAGTGKTSTLIMLGNDDYRRRGQYLAFNKSIVTEAQSKFPRQVACNTAHSLAFRAVGREYAHRLNGNRMPGRQLAISLDLTPLQITVEGKPKTLQPGFLASLVQRAITRFCQTADTEVGQEHFPYIDGIDMPHPDTGHRTYDNNHRLARTLLPAARFLWADIERVDGQLPYKHEHYLKQWQLRDPVIEADYILFDEAQDANPVMLAAIGAQRNAQLVYVGDTQQQIYEFTGAVNALQNIATERVSYLTRSFRFGPEIAEIANQILEDLGAALRLTGAGPAGTVDVVETPQALLCRTNAMAVAELIASMTGDRRAHMLGGGSEVISFVKAVLDMQAGRRPYHPDLVCFDTWADVVHYVSEDESGSDLKLLVNLVEQYGADTICNALEAMPTERNADLVISTAHKAKGREWGSVQLASDYPEPKEERRDEQRLLYVAVTRAKTGLDIAAVPHLSGDMADALAVAEW